MAEERDDSIEREPDADADGAEAVTARQVAEDLYTLCLAGLVRLDSDDRGQLRALILDDY